MHKYVGYACGAVVAGTILGCGTPAPTPKQGDEYGARSVCQDFVKDSLKSPASAKFSEETATLSKGEWTVTGSVDSENSFGASIRNVYVCTVKHTGNDNYHLIDLTGLSN